MKNVIQTLLFFALLSTSAFGRAPAVEPVGGISIDQYQETDPVKDPGFNWRQDDYVQETSLITTRVPAEAKLINKTTNQNKTWPTYAFLISLISLPFVLWYSIMKSLESPGPQNGEAQSVPTESIASTYNLQEERQKRQSEENQSSDDISKAS